ncbi:PLP-dependent aminotransferase family protein [Glutamicibacter ectropisis]|uniref:PLP-dependent aminotransferase family protein n=1 Tax=Glutamicibacter ectropisis TaxID=3046593 RepID=A0AAU6WCW9_9MICC
MTVASALHTSELVGRFSKPQGFGDATLRSPRTDSIELLGGIPDPEVLPVAELTAATERVLLRSGVPALQYSRTEGITELREWIAAREGVSADRIIVTNGGFHGLSLAIQALINPGDLVAVDNPIFPLFLRGLELATTNILPVPVGAAGLDVDALEGQLRAGVRPKALYTVPDFHNPTQGSLSRPDRQRLVELAAQYGFVLLADNPYRELYFGTESASYREFNDSENVIHINTFTKTLGPGLRLGWLVVPNWLRSDISALRSRQDSHSSTLIQSIVAEALTHEETLFDATLDKARATYRNRAQVLATALETETQGALDIELPNGGLFLWPKIVSDRIDPQKLSESARSHGVDYQQGAFFPSGPGTEAARHLRLSFGHVSEENLKEGARRIGLAFKDQG